MGAVVDGTARTMIQNQRNFQTVNMVAECLPMHSHRLHPGRWARWSRWLKDRKDTISNPAQFFDASQVSKILEHEEVQLVKQCLD